jgi:hypothetical protein
MGAGGSGRPQTIDHRGTGTVYVPRRRLTLAPARTCRRVWQAPRSPAFATTLSFGTPLLHSGILVWVQGTSPFVLWHFCTLALLYSGTFVLWYFCTLVLFVLVLVVSVLSTWYSVLLLLYSGTFVLWYLRFGYTWHFFGTSCPVGTSRSSCAP